MVNFNKNIDVSLRDGVHFQGTEQPEMEVNKGREFRNITGSPQELPITEVYRSFADSPDVHLYSQVEHYDQYPLHDRVQIGFEGSCSVVEAVHNHIPAAENDYMNVQTPVHAEHPVESEAPYMNVSQYMNVEEPAIEGSLAIISGQMERLQAGSELQVESKKGMKSYHVQQAIGSGHYKEYVHVAQVALNSIPVLDLKHKAIGIYKDVPKNRAEMLERENEIALNTEIHAQRKRGANVGHIADVKVVTVMMGSKKQMGLMGPLAQGNVNALLDRPLHKADRLFVAKEMAHGLLELHDLGIVHRDIKPDNFLFFF